jgi:hypothetical protein
MWHKGESNFQYFVSVLYFRLFVNIFVSKKENKSEKENDSTNKASLVS